MKVKVLENYFDLVLRKQIAAGEELEVTNERGSELFSKNLVEIIEQEEIAEQEPNLASEAVEIKVEPEVVEKPKKAKKGK